MQQQQWYYAIEQQQFGPVPQDKIIELLQNGTLNRQSYVWTDGFADWKIAGDVETFVDYLPAEPVTNYQAGQRPTSVTVFGILNIVFGSLGIIFTPVSMVFLFEPSDAMDPTAIVYAWFIFGSVLGLATSGLQIALGVGLLKLRAWARKWTVYYACFAIFWAVFATAINLILIVTEQYNYTQDALAGAYAGSCGGLIGGLIYPILLVIFMNRQIAKDACIK